MRFLLLQKFDTIKVLQKPKRSIINSMKSPLIDKKSRGKHFPLRVCRSSTTK